jgi:PLP dependent protein
MIRSADELRANLDRVRAAIEAACERSGRDPSDVRLVAITKELPVDVVRWAAECGIGDFGENYVNELTSKREAASEATWHYVGTLQSHNAHKVADHADVVHSAAGGRAMERLAHRAASNGGVLPILVQIDFAGRASGVSPEDAPGCVDRAAELEGVDPIGLMTLPPQPQRPEDARPYFARLRELRDELSARFPKLVELSMGMSLDYEIAVEEGASMVRVGTALFGPRPSTLGD